MAAKDHPRARAATEVERAFFDAVSALHRAGIPSIALKGAGLMARSPEVARTRHTDDIDLWVEPARAAEADRVLRSRGYDDLPRPPRPVAYDGLPRPPTHHTHQLPPLRSARARHARRVVARAALG
jgi:hypothetical protein